MAMGHKPNREPFQKGIAFSTQCTAMADAVHCEDGCSALQERLQCTASGMAKLMPKSILLFRTSK